MISYGVFGCQASSVLGSEEADGSNSNVILCLMYYHHMLLWSFQSRRVLSIVVPSLFVAGRCEIIDQVFLSLHNVRWARVCGLERGL